MRSVCGTALMCFVACAAGAQPSATTAIVGGTLVNSDGSPPLPNSVIVLRGERIVAVGSAENITIEPNARRFDAAGKWITPGLIDAHVHFFQSGGLYARPDIIDLRGRVPYSAEIEMTRARITDTFARYLRAGITSVADVGGPMWNFDVRELARSTAVAPRVAAAGPLLSPFQPLELASDDPPIVLAQSPHEARELVRRQAERRPDFIKIWYVPTDESYELYLPTVRAAIEESHAHGIRVAVHATELETARAAVLAGADVLVHGVEDRDADDAFVRELRQNDVIYTTTLSVYEGYGEALTQQVKLTAADYALGDPFAAGSLFDLAAIPMDELPPAFAVSPGERAPPPTNTIALRNLRRVHDAGVTVALGTDAGNIGTLHASSLQRELELMREAGLTPAQALRAATQGGARALGRSSEVGAIAPGMLADLVVLDADPLLDVRNLLAVHRVVKGGQIFVPDEILPVRPEALVQRQVNAYNAHDIDAFVATYARDVQVFNHPVELVSDGRDALRRDYAELFAAAPNLHTEIVDRITIGEYVIDRERVTGFGQPFEAVAIYRVRAELIDRVWFVFE
jgi:imidazolonepropionase-like amidohydrolase